MLKNSALPIAIIGAGPAGLAASVALSETGIKSILYDTGKNFEQRIHNHADDLGIGVGGAGLFSDGKFSYYPSATHLYKLFEQATLRHSYSWMADTLNKVDINSEKFPEHYNFDPTQDTVKVYASAYGSLDQRTELVRSLIQNFSGTLLTNAEVTEINKTKSGYEIISNSSDGKVLRNFVSGIVLANGRFGSIYSSIFTFPLPLFLHRYEFGIRIEHPSSKGFLTRTQVKDVKKIWEERGVNFRTFCTCRNGELWNIPYGDFSALSGRSDGPATNYSNFGLLARFYGSSLKEGKAIWDALHHTMLTSNHAVWQPIKNFLGGSDPDLSLIDPQTRPWFPQTQFVPGNIKNILGDSLYTIMHRAVTDLVAWSPDLLSDETVCFFPAIEGVGHYPETDLNLQIPGEQIWCAGDVVGKFRGIVAAMVSGHYVGTRIAELD